MTAKHIGQKVENGTECFLQILQFLQILILNLVFKLNFKFSFLPLFNSDKKCLEKPLIGPVAVA